MSSTDEDKICFSGSERIKKMDLVLLAREDSKIIDAVPRTEPILYSHLYVDWKKTLGNQNWSLAHPSRMPALNLIAVVVGYKEGSGAISFNS